jgi:hypothetical protein
MNSRFHSNLPPEREPNTTGKASVAPELKPGGRRRIATKIRSIHPTELARRVTTLELC